MTIRNLSHFFEPKSVALIGASGEPGSVGSVLARNLVRGGLNAPVYPVNPNHSHVLSLPAYPSISSLPEIPELAVIATPPDTVPQIIHDLGSAGTKAAIVITAGFAESVDKRGRDLQQAMLDASQPHLLRIIGPNCLGVMVPKSGLNASFAGTEAKKGRLAFVTQSGAVVTAVVDWADERDIGFSHLVSLGGMADVDFGDMLDYLALDRTARAILLYVEAVTNPRKFMSAARAAARAKPVIVVKAGRFAEGARAAASHTGAMAGTDEVYDAVFRRAGLLRVYSLHELFDAAETLSKLEVPAGDGVVIVTNGGGAGVLAADALVEQGGRLAKLTKESLEALNKVLPPTWSHGNPVDIIGDATAERYSASLEVLLGDKTVDAVLVLNCPTAIASGTSAAKAVIEVVQKKERAIVLTSWMGGREAEKPRQLFSAHGVPTYETPSDASRAFMHLVRYRKSQTALMETPPSIPEEFKPDTERAKTIIDAVLAEGRKLLTEPEAKDVLAAYRIPTTKIRIASSPEDARSAAKEFSGPVVLKILSKDITHKSDVGGVVLGLSCPEDTEIAAQKMLEQVQEAVPDASIDGFTIQEMIHRPRSSELIVGMKDDAQFGPTLLFGQGGTAVELIGDTALGMPPLNMRLAREMISQTHINKILQGFRDQPPADLEAIALTLIKVSQLVVDVGEIAQLDINPLLADASGVVALDARIAIKGYDGDPHRRLAIKPYPKELEDEVRLGDGRVLLLRPIRGEDEPMLRAGFAKLTPEEVHNRFFGAMKTLEHVMASRLAQINYDREMAFVLTEPGIAGRTEIFGVARLAADPDNERAEYAVIVRSDMTGLGLGVLLMRRIISYAKQKGLREIFGDVLSQNNTMLRICDVLGFERSVMPDEPQLVRVTLKL